MESITSCLDGGHIGVFESPTGTGKTLSLICATLSWLVEQRAQEPQEEQAAPGENWVVAASRRSRHTRRLQLWRERLERRAALVDKLRGLMTSYRSQAAASSSTTTAASGGSAPEDLCLPDVDVLAKRRRVEIEEEQEEEQQVEAEQDPSIKIFFCSRTHTQLSQFIEELQKTLFGKDQQVLTVCLASRRNLCVNPAVNSLASSTLINDACRDLRDTSKGCPYYSKPLLQQLAEHALAAPIDIEDLLRQGARTSCCSYYASRKAIKDAELIIMPYQVLLHQPTREALGIDVTGHVLVVDEAHNLIDAINDVYSQTLTIQQTVAAKTQLEGYVSRYKSRLSHANLGYLRQMDTILAAVKLCMENMASHKAPSRLLTLAEYVFEMNVDTINMFDLLRYIELARLGNIMRGFSLAEMADQGLRSSFQSFASFLGSLTNTDSDGRILVTPKETRFLLLDPEEKFRAVAAEARSIVLAGGTLGPPEVLAAQLAPTALDRVTSFSCGHVVDAANICLLSVSSGPSGRPLNYSYEQRSTPETLKELEMLLVNVTRVVPEGMVVFFSSYSYEEMFFRHLEQHGGLPRIQANKRLFRGREDSVFQRYSDNVSSGSPSILFAVVGGKLSEGINFSDALGRCVVMVGVPYPNAKDPVLQEKKRLLDAAGGVVNGQKYYQTMCAKALNQSIGRAIRHREDYAAVLLVDSRFTPQVLQWVPHWIRRSLVQQGGGFGASVAALGQFFRGKRG